MNSLKKFLLLLILVCMGTSAHAAVLLQIDITDPSNVIITATSNVSSANSSASDFNSGITLLGFFSSTIVPGEDLAVSSSLTAAQTSEGPSFDSYYRLDVSGTTIDLNLFSSEGLGVEQTYVFGLTALTGSMVIDLSAYFGSLSLGSGDIIAGDSETAPVIGQYQVVGTVPEPSTYALFTLGLTFAGFVLYRRRAVQA